MHFRFDLIDLYFDIDIAIKTHTKKKLFKNELQKNQQLINQINNYKIKFLFAIRTYKIKSYI